MFQKTSFRELSSIGSALAIVIVGIAYFPDAFLFARSAELRLWGPGMEWQALDPGRELLTLFVAAVGLLIAIEIIYHIAVAIMLREHGPEPKDERDRQVDMKAARIAHGLLLVGLFVLMTVLFQQQPPTLVTIQYLLLLVYASEFARHASRFGIYRLGG